MSSAGKLVAKWVIFKGQLSIRPRRGMRTAAKFPPRSAPIDFVSLKDEVLVVAGKATPQVAEAHHRSPNQNSFESTYACFAHICHIFITRHLCGISMASTLKYLRVGMRDCLPSFSFILR